MNKNNIKLIIQKDKIIKSKKSYNINMNGGIFNITIKDGIIKKELKNITEIKNKNIYNSIIKNSSLFTNVIMNIHNDTLIGNFIEPALNVNGSSYSMKYISNSICLNNIEEIKKLTIEVKEDIKKQIITIFSILKNNYPNIKGDWLPSNLIYDKDRNKVLNIDLEGFFSYNENYYKNRQNGLNIWVIDPEIKILSSLK